LEGSSWKNVRVAVSKLNVSSGQNMRKYNADYVAWAKRHSRSKESHIHGNKVPQSMLEILMLDNYVLKSGKKSKSHEVSVKLFRKANYNFNLTGFVCLPGRSSRNSSYKVCCSC
jgi:hypothetical protein